MTTPYVPQNVAADQADGKILITWDVSPGATVYCVFRYDLLTMQNVNFNTVVNSFVDTTCVLGRSYAYYVSAAAQQWSAYSATVIASCAPPGEMSLAELRLRSQQTADRVNSQFVTTSEWNSFLRLALYELYDILVDTYEDYFIAPYAYINTDATTDKYDLPDGVTNYDGGILGAPTSTKIPALYKLRGVDLGVNTSNNAWVTINKFNYIDRNKFVYPNSTSTIYGVYNMRYRVMGNKIQFIPIPSGNQQIRLTYIPRLPALLFDGDITTIGYSGWLRYVIVRAAKYALDKEEGSDTSKLDAELVFLKQRIEATAPNRDAGQPDTISETRKEGMFGIGWNQAGW